MEGLVRVKTKGLVRVLKGFKKDNNPYPKGGGRSTKTTPELRATEAQLGLGFGVEAGL